MSSMYKYNMSFMRTHKKHANKVKLMRSHKLSQRKKKRTAQKMHCP